MIGLLIVILATGLILLFSLRRYRTRHPLVFRRIPAIQKLRRAIGLAVEDGKGIHISLGKASLLLPSSTSAFIGLSTLHRLGQLSATSDHPPVATSGDGGIAILSQDVLHLAARDTNTSDLYDPNHGQLAGVTPLSYIAGSLPVVTDPSIKTNLLIGNFGPEAGLLTAASEDKDDFTMAASDSIAAQSVFYATTREPLIGEELYAVPAYLQYSPAHQASLKTQDLLRWLLVIAMIGGSLMKIFGWI